MKKVSWDNELAVEAQKSAENCSNAGKLVHTVSSRRAKCADILQYATWKMSGAEAVNRWKTSDGHRKMMQCPTANKAGVAAYKDSKGKWWYVIVYSYTGNSNQGGN